jgi:DNA polymerase-3 subunit gamma/tau
VAAAKPVAHQEEKPVSKEEPVKRPAVKLSNLGMTFGSLRNTSLSEKEEKEADTIDSKEHQTFTNEQLMMQWVGMCNRMPQQMVCIAFRMKNMESRILDFPKVEVVVDNETLLEEMKDIQKRIRSTLALTLHNSDIELNLRLAKSDEVKKILTRREQLEEMMKDNPALKKLSTMLHLELV